MAPRRNKSDAVGYFLLEWIDLFAVMRDMECDGHPPFEMISRQPKMRNPARRRRVV
jgi:hypothetical protein